MRTINISKLKIIVTLLVAILIDCQLFAQVPSGNKLWFRADKGVLNGGTASLNGQKVTIWQDFSLDASVQNAGACTVHFSDAGEVLPDFPSYSYSITNSLNYNPIISFDGSGDGNALEFDTPVQGDQTVFVVFKALGKRGLHYSQPLLYGGDVSSPSEPGIDRVDLAFTVNDKSVSFGGGHSRDFTKNGNMNLNGRPGIGVFSRKVWADDHITPNLYVNGATDLLNDDNSFNGVGLINPDKMRMGKHYSNTDGNLNGLIAEVMVYDCVLSDAERKKVESYLAIKYGITLNSGNDILGCDNGNNNFNYINSAGNIIWVPETSYKYDVAGLGKDSGFDLNQGISKSSNEGTILSMSMDNDFSEGNLKNRSAIAEGDFLFWSNNTGSHNPVVEQTSERPTDQTPNLILKRLDREWKVQETNTDGTNPGVVSIMVDLNGVACSARSTNDLILLIDKDGDGNFSTGTLDRYNASSFVSNQVVFDNVDLLDGQIFTVATHINLNDPVITATNKSVAEGNTVVETVTATDADAGDSKTFSITGGADAALFEIDPITGELTFKVAPDFENPADNGGDNIYDVTVTVTDGANHTDSESIAVTVTGVNDNDPVISATDKTIPEGTTVVQTVTATDADAGDSKTFSITGGADAALFEIDPITGELTFKLAPDFENPADNGGDNIYDVTVTVTDGANHTDSESIAVTVTGVNDNDPVISATDKTIPEGTTVVQTVTATDADAGDSKTFSITGGADAALFEIDPITGELTFKVAPDFENPADNGGDNIYNVTVTVTDGTNHTDSESIAVTVTGVNDNDPVISATDKTIPEGTTVVQTVTATDADAGDSKTFSITGGADAALFEIDPITGELTFKLAPDFENPADNGGDNIYNVTVTVTDGTNHTDSESIAVTVTGVNDNDPVISATDKTIAEGTTVVQTVTATDADAGDSKTFSITGGADAALFEIDPITGELTFKVAPDFENPADNGGDNIYDVTVTVTDGANHTDSESIAVTVTGVNDNDPVISATDKTIPEGTTVVQTVTATDADAGDSKTFSITGGADAALFEIDPITGELTFKLAPDFENPADNGGDNIYDVTVTVTDGANHTDSESIAVTVTGVNDNDPVISATDKTIAEGTTVVQTVTATDADAGDSKTFSITGGADAALFEIDPITGELTFKVAPDFENPADNGGDNIYDVTVTVTDGANHTDSESIAVTVTGVNDNDPVISATDKTIAEGTTVVQTVTATDADAGDSKTFSITGGADAALFEIDPITGELTFKVAPDFENPADNGGDNIYDVTVTVTDGANHTDSESIAVTVTGVNDNDPVISATDKTIAEGTTVVQTVTATDADAGDSKTFSITGGADAALFEIDPITGELTFKVAPDFENPADNGGDNIYDVTVTVTDGANHTDSESIAVTVTGVNDNDPVISATDKTIPEGTTVVQTVTATDADAGDSKTFSITGGADAALFEIDPITGELTFKVAPDFENPADNGGDNIYDVTVTVTDGANHTDSESIAVTVTGVNDNDPVISATDKTIPEGTTVVQTVTATDADAGDSKTFSITGGADAALFEIDPITGELTFKVAPDFENPADNGGDNIYDVTVTVTDGANHTDSESIAVTVTGVNDNDPVISATDKTIAEGTTVVETVTATDADAGDSKTFSITGGADAALFEIDPITGELTFKVAPDFENPADNGGDNIYDVTVTVTDGANHTDSESIAVTVTGVNDNDPVISATDKTIAEGTTVVETVTATDADAGDSKTFSITGGADAALFEIDPITGELTFKVAPDFENPADNGGDNIYDVTVTVTDGANHTDSESIAVTVTGVNDNDPVISATDKTIAEGTTVVQTVTATDADAGDSKTFSITGGADAALFEIDPITGELTFKVAPDFENPADNGGDNIYDVTVTVTDGANHTDSESIAVTVTGVNDNDPVISATDKTIAEGTTVVETVTATDADAGDSKTFSITGGADAALFEIDPITGELTFKVAPDFENPADNGGDNIYDVTVTVTDGANHTDSESIAVTVTGVNDNDPVISATDKTIPEGTTVVQTVTATDADAGDSKTFSITGGADAALFEIDPITGELTFKLAPDFENPADNGGDNIYDVTVTVTDGANHTDSESIAVTVTGVNDNDPVISATDKTIPEGTTVVQTVTATDADAGDSKTFSITGGADAALFEIDPITGELTFKVAPDFENPADNGGDNIYNVTVTVTDGTNHTDSESIAVTVTGVNDNDPVISATDKTIPEGTTVVQTVTATDADAGDSKTFSITGGADAALFEIDPITGELTFKLAPDFENPADNGGDNIYNVTVTVTDGTNHTDSESIAVTVTGVNDNDPVISATDKTIPEGTTVVQTVTATDADAGDSKTFSITGGADAALFEIDPITGELTFKVAPDFENPADNGGDNIYDVTVTVTDGANHTDSESIAVTVTGVNDNDPVISATDKTIPEGTTVVQTVTATDADAGDSKTFSITGGADAALFEIDPITGELTFKLAPDFENPADNGGDNIYDVTVTVTDGANHTDSESIAVTVTGVNDNDPVISATDKTIAEGTTVVQTVSATDADAGDSKTFSITGGADAALFEIDPITGELTFKVAPDFENPADNGGDNIYDVTVTVTDGANHTDSESIAVTVTGVNDNDPVISATDKTIPEGTTVVQTVSATDADAGDSKTFSITGGADAALFEIDPITGELTFKVAPDFENPADNGGDNIYDVTVTVTDGANHTDSESIAVTVTGVNDNDPVISATDKTIAEGTTVVETVTATDADAGDSKTFSITGGADAALFEIDPITGELTFKVAPDFENPADNGGDNIYDVTVTVTDGANHTDSESIAVTVTGVNDNTPDAQDDNASIDEGETLNGSNLLDNDTDLDGDGLNIVTTPIKTVTHGTLIIHADGTYTYVPDPFFNGIDSFIYEVCDNGSPKNCSQATVEINVAGVNNKPYGQDKEISLPYESKEADLEITEPIDPDGDDMHIEILVLPKYGQIYTEDGILLKIGDQISIVDLLKLKFDANSKFVGNCLFKYRIYDSKGLFSEAQVLINITNDLFIPNVFTPNSDPFNDTFTILGIENYPNNKIIIYNRWGNKVYTMQSYDNSWRGYGNVSRLISKDRLPIGTYYYILYLGEDKTPITGYIYMTY